MIDFLFDLTWRTTSSISNHWQSHLTPLLCKNINVTTNKLESSSDTELEINSSTLPVKPHQLLSSIQGSLVTWKHIPLLEVNAWPLPEPPLFAKLLRHSLWSFPCNLSKQHPLSCKVVTCIQSTRSSRLSNLWKSNMERLKGKCQFSELLQGFKMLIALNAEGHECRLLCH